MPRPGSTAATGIGYGGEYRDGTGLINLRARSYDPVLTRFIGRDTFGGVASAPQTGNRYAYALSNPLRYSDPSGHFVNKVIHDPSLLLGAAAFIPGPVGLAALGMLGAIAGITALTGTDPLTGQQVEGPARFVGLALFAVPIFGKVVGSAAEAWGEVGALGRSATETEAALADGVRLGEAGAGEVGGGARVGGEEVGATLGRSAEGASEIASGSTYSGVREASSYLKSIGIPRAVRKQWLGSFDVRTISVRQAGLRDYGMRFYDNSTARAGGATLFRTFPASRSSLAIRYEWNDITNFTQFQIRPGATIFEGRVAPQGPFLQGGDRQILLPSWREDLLEPAQ